MELRPIGANDLPKARELWKRAFSDSDVFMDVYFATEENTRHTLGFFEDGIPLSQLFMPPFRVRLCGTDYEVGFLSGCATAPEARNRNLMRKLVRAAFEDMLGRGIAISFLHPFLHAFYRKFGYETIAFVNRYQTRKEQKAPSPGVTVESSLGNLPVDEFQSAYARYMKAFDNYFIRSPQRYDTWLKMNFIDGAKAAYIRGADQSFSYALYYEKEDGISEIFELVYFTDAELNAILDTLGPANFFLPESRLCSYANPVREEFTMMRVLDPIAVLRQKQFASVMDVTLHIEDDFLGKVYDLRVKADRSGVAVTEIEKASDFVIDIRQFTQMAACVDHASSIEDGVGIFSHGTGCFFETF